MTPFTLRQILSKLDMPLGTTRLVRHNAVGAAHLRRGGPTRFGCFASFQYTATNPYKDADAALHFIPGPTLENGDVTALFVGATHIRDRWIWDGMRIPAMNVPAMVAAEPVSPEVQAFDLEWVEPMAHLSERLLVHWGPSNSAVAWRQWARNDKAVLELLMKPRDPPFPGFASLAITTDSVPTLWQGWRETLQAVHGIYLLVAPDGAQYVGSATGQDGFLGRWSAYAANGHGGNELLIAAGHRSYDVSILEVASPDMSAAEILAREGFWKLKLGSRAHGLNAN